MNLGKLYDINGKIIHKIQFDGITTALQTSVTAITTIMGGVTKPNCNHNPLITMKRKLNNRRGGFTLVEIMIVVAIIALLATIAIPNFLRARKRSQASAVLEDLRLIDQAKDQYAIEFNKKGSDGVDWTAVKAYIKPTTQLYIRGGKDLFGNSYTINSVDVAPKAASETYAAFNDIDLTTDFWGAFGQ